MSNTILKPLNTFQEGLTRQCALLIQLSTLCVKEALGPLIWDMDDNVYVDYIGGFGLQFWTCSP